MVPDPLTVLWEELNRLREAGKAPNTPEIPRSVPSAVATPEERARFLAWLLLIAVQVPACSARLFPALASMCNSLGDGRKFADMIEAHLAAFHRRLIPSRDSDALIKISRGLAWCFVEPAQAAKLLNMSPLGSIWLRRIVGEVLTWAAANRIANKGSGAMHWVQIARYLSPDDPHVLQEWSGAAIINKDYNEVEAYLNQQLENKNNLVVSSFCLGRLADAQGEFRRAERWYRLCLELNPRDLAALTNLGANLYRQRRAREAEVYYRQALVESKGLFNPAGNLLYVLTAQGRVDAEAACAPFFLAACQTFQSLTNERYAWEEVECLYSHGLLRIASILTDFSLVGEPTPGSGGHPFDHVVGWIVGVLFRDWTDLQPPPFKYWLGLMGLFAQQARYPATDAKPEHIADLRARVHNLAERCRSVTINRLTTDELDQLRDMEIYADASSEKEYTAAMLQTEAAWLRQAAVDEAAGVARDLRARLSRYLRAHIWAYGRARETHDAQSQRMHLERIHRCMELLKGRWLLHRWARPGTPNFDSYAKQLPASVSTSVLGIADIQTALRERGGPSPVAISFYSLDNTHGVQNREFVVMIIAPESVDFRTLGAESYKRIARFTFHLEKVVRMHELAGNCRFDELRELMGMSEDAELSPNGVVDWVKDELAECYRCLLENIIPNGLLDSRTVWVSPSAEMGSLPFGLFRCRRKYLAETAASIITVPILSLRHQNAEAATAYSGAQVVYGQRVWRDCRCEQFLEECREVRTIPKEERGDYPFAEGRPADRGYGDLLFSLQEKKWIDLVAHYEDWNGRSASLGHFWRLVMLQGMSLNSANMVLRVCRGRMVVVDTVTGEVLGLWVSLLGAGINRVVASPLTVWPLRTLDDGRLSSDCFFRALHAGESVGGSVELARRVQIASDALRAQSFESSDLLQHLPTFWGAYEVVAPLPVHRSARSAKMPATGEARSDVESSDWVFEYNQPVAPRLSG